MSKRLIVTQAFSGPSRDYMVQNFSDLKQYAAKCNAGFFMQHQRQRPFDPLGFEKWTYKALLQEYDQILHIDADTIVRADCPDIFSLVPEGHFGAVDEKPFEDPQSERPFIDRGVDMQTYGPLESVKFYVNVGVFLVTPAQASIFDEPIDTRGHFAEQSLINYRLHTQGHKVHLLPPTFNHMHLMEKKGLPRSEANIIHYAGRWGGLSPEQVLERMRNDRIRSKGGHNGQ
jgi:lipopolysaccharide biosynthesis glycosyltransferase